VRRATARSWGNPAPRDASAGSDAAQLPPGGWPGFAQGNRSHAGRARSPSGLQVVRTGEADGEGFQGIHQADGTPAEFPWGDRERYFRNAGEQGAEGDLSLHAGQGSAQAVVDAVTEGDVAAGVAAEVEAVRAGELGGIPVGGTGRDEDPLACCG